MSRSDKVYPPQSGGPAPQGVLVSSTRSGSREQFIVGVRSTRGLLARQSLVMPIKGASRKSSRGLFIWAGKGYLDARSAKKDGRQLTLWFLDTHHFNDQLADMIGSRLGEGEEQIEQWALNKRDDPQYNEHMSNVRKILVRRGMIAHHEWVPISGARIDYRDCEVYQVAGAYMRNVQSLPPPEVLQQFREKQRRQMEANRRRPSQHDNRDPWIPTPL